MTSPRQPLDYQPDIYQRYSVLAAVVDGLRSAVPSPSTALLDVGCGPERLTEVFIGEGVAITRADVDRFGQPDVQLLPGDGSLPFEDRAFDVVVALDVLEHVPADIRPALVSEMARVAQSAVVLSFPHAHPAVAAAEDALQQIAREFTGGKSIAFLDEHAGFGLPDSDALMAALRRHLPHATQFGNAPIGDWLVYNTFDLAYACDFGDGHEKAGFNAAVNRRLRRTGPLDATYRRVIVGARSGTDLQTMIGAVEALDREAGRSAPGDPFTTARAAAAFRMDFRRMIDAERSTIVGNYTTHIDGLMTAIEEFREAIAAKDAHIANLDAIIQQLQRKRR